MATPTKLPRPQTTSSSPPSPLKNIETPKGRAKASPASKIPSPPKTTSSGRESRQGWRPPGAVDQLPRPPRYLSPNSQRGPASTPLARNGWKPPGTVDTRPRNGGYKSPEVLKSSPSNRFSRRNYLPSVPSTLKNKLPTTEPESRGTFPASWKNPSNGATSWWGAEGIPFVEIMRRQNPNIDRSPAVLNEPCVPKLFIRLRNAYGRPIEREYPNSMNWSSMDRIHALNRWRNKILEHYLGPAEGEEVRPHALEHALILEAYQALESAAEGMHPFVGKELPSWAGIAQDINVKFGGQKLDGDEHPRPRITREMLRRRYLVPLKDAEERGPANSSVREVCGRAALEIEARGSNCSEPLHPVRASRIPLLPRSRGAPKPVHEKALAKQPETKGRISRLSPFSSSTGSPIRRRGCGAP